MAGITYVMNGGINNTSNPITYETGDVISLLAPERVGYSFVNWYYDSKFIRPVEGTLNTAAGNDITVYAKWNANQYNVTYDVNGGDALENGVIYDLTYDRAYPKTLATPTRVGYSFAGWFTERDGGSKIVGGTTKFTAVDPDNAVIYAHWTPYSYTIRFNSNTPDGKNTVKTQKATYDASVTLTANSFKVVGGSFAGWNTDKEGRGTTYADKAVVTENLVNGSKNNDTVDLYAQWNTVDYVVFFDTGVDDGVAGDGSLKIGATSIPGTTPEDFKAATGIDVSVVSGNGYLQAMKYGEEFELSGDEFVRAGYSITGWKNSKTGRNIANSAIKNLTTANEVITLTAQWSKDKYNVTYNLNGGAYKKGAAKGVASYTVDNEMIVLPDDSTIARTGYSFDGWYDNKEFEGEAYTYVGGDVLKNLTLFAKWDLGEYRLTLDPNEGYVQENYSYEDMERSMTVNDTYKLDKGFVGNDGYTLDSWNTQADGKGKKYAVNAVISKMSDDLTLYAIWKPVKYTVKYNLDGGKQTGAATSYTTDKGLELKIPTKAGFKFDGWEIEAVSGEADISSEIVDGQNVYSIAANDRNYGNLTLKAEWLPYSYGVRIHHDSTDTVEPILIGTGFNYGVKYPVTTLVREVHYSGWEDASKINALTTKPDGKGTKLAVSGSFTNLSAVDGAVVDVYAVCGIKDNYMITYDLDGGILSNPVYSYDGSRDVTIADPVKSGYAFKGWMIDYSSDNEEDLKMIGTVVDDEYIKKLKIKAKSCTDIELTAVYDETSHVVTIDAMAKDARFAEDFTDAKGVTYRAGDAVPAKFDLGSYVYGVPGNLPVIERNGYEFIGFNLAKKDDAKSYVDNLGLATTGAKVTLYAIWKPITYTIAYRDMDGITNPNATRIVAGNKVTLKNVTKKGYTFKGWKLAEAEDSYNPATVKVTTNKDGMVTQINADSAGNIALVPVFAENMYTIKISANGAKSTDAKANPATITLAGDKAFSQDVVSEIANMVGLFRADGETATYTKKGYVFAGFATDAKGNNLIIDVYGSATGVYSDGVINGLSDKNKAVVTIYAAWEKVEASRPVIKSANLNGDGNAATVTFAVPYTAAKVSYEVQCSSSIIFRNSVTKAEVFEDVTTDELTIDTATTSGTNYIRIRQIKTDSQGNAVTGKWSKRFIAR